MLHNPWLVIPCPRLRADKTERLQQGVNNTFSALPNTKRARRGSGKQPLHGEEWQGLRRGSVCLDSMGHAGKQASSDSRKLPAPFLTDPSAPCLTREYVCATSRPSGAITVPIRGFILDNAASRDNSLGEIKAQLILHNYINPKPSREHCY